MTVVGQSQFAASDFARYDKVSFIGTPNDESILYVGKKIEDRLANLAAVKSCLVFIEEGMAIPEPLTGQHTFVVCESAICSYAVFVRRIAEQETLESRRAGYTMTPEGYYIGKNVVLGDNVFIEPGVLLDHGVTIGSYTVVQANSVIRHTTIGSNCLIKTNAVIGDQGFTMYTDANGNKDRVFCLGSVAIEDNVEIGSFTTVCRGQNTATTVGAYSKLDDHVYIAHDVIIGKNVIIAAAATIGGYDRIGDDVFMGLNATAKQLIDIGSGAFVKMSARVTKDVVVEDR
jgi:UDP-3-O-[3-hydroxymyristoyl] glucosamine N-acyltransferase